ncbi:hypothetical protein DAPPUDRAFT_257000 [Daphnia pulex]|uniref:Uncharacterized protein n=1 Tax=Daphnia pulex TaxID=6669 RepID=E9HCN6_DAPPU|nr:hypothetical protein DAPPUDRAFT_257000 [Daphnia pulex]|eukprot:EFX70507.1 hypothetical protein DAPPUDRAFT_257000 [Daphnia pulex]
MVQVLEVVLVFIACIHAILDWIWFEMAEYFESLTETEIEPVGSNEEPSQNRVPETNLMQKQSSQTRIITPPIMWKPDQVSALLPDTVLPDTVLPDTTLPDTVLIPESFSEGGLTALPECESEDRKFQPKNEEKPDSSDERIKQIKEENSKLKIDLETSATELSLKCVEIQRLTAVTNELNQKLQKTSLKNDELILKLASVRNMASTSQSEFNESESKLTKELTELKVQLIIQQKLLEEKEMNLESITQDKKMADQKVEEIHKQDFNLFLTDLTEMKRTTEQLKADNQRISEARDAAILSAEETRILAEERQSQIDELKKEKAARKAVQLSNASTWAVTESQLRNEIKNLKANSTQTENETQSESELKRLKDETSLLNASLESVRESLAEKTTKNNELSSRNLELVGKNSLLEEKNETLMKETKDFREKLARQEKEIEDVWENHDAVLESALRSEKLAKEQVEALSEALAALQEAVKDTEDSAKATKAERQSMNSDDATKAPDQKKVTWIKKLLGKRKTQKSHHNGEDAEYANLLETTGLEMVERAKNLQPESGNAHVPPIHA